jgi:hypothetical protein
MPARLRILALALAWLEGAVFVASALAGHVAAGDAGYDRVCWERSPACLAAGFSSACAFAGAHVAALARELPRRPRHVLGALALALGAPRDLSARPLRRALRPACS